MKGERDGRREKGTDGGEKKQKAVIGKSVKRVDLLKQDVHKLNTRAIFTLKREYGELKRVLLPTGVLKNLAG